MKLIVSIVLLSMQLFASTILSYKTYERSDRVDLLLTFDTPYNGRISQKQTLNKTTILLYDAQYKEQIQKSLSSDFLNAFSIIPQSSRTALVLSLAKDIQYKVSKTVDNYGLRLRFYRSKSNKVTPSQLSPKASLSSLRTKPENQTTSSYIFVVAILLLAVLFLLFIKKRMLKTSGGKGWLFKDSQKSNEQFNILFQKPIDNTNKVVLLEVNSKQYLVILGNSHLLLDTYNNHEIKNEDAFESILKENQEELDSYMKIPENHQEDDFLQSYKEKASIEAYRSQM
ncbi:hypothetical protein JHD50_04260 [Sulfurimonas sp. MAG313]|nr:hypothetical protein [Sulfurimonas sp. MAG313]MDF1880524.1 hypothetical protein [Sulfurimonas sp. MAG313]